METLVYALSESTLSLIIFVATLVIASLAFGAELRKSDKSFTFFRSKTLRLIILIVFSFLIFEATSIKDEKTNQKASTERRVDSSVNLTRYSETMNRSIRIIDSLNTEISISKKQLHATDKIVEAQNKQSATLTKQLQTTVGILNQTTETLTNSRQTIQQLNGMITSFKDIRVEYGLSYHDSVKFFKNINNRRLLNEALKITSASNPGFHDNGKEQSRYHFGNVTIFKTVVKGDSAVAALSFNMHNPAHTQLDSLLPEVKPIALEFARKIDTSNVKTDYAIEPLKLRSEKIEKRSAYIKINPFALYADLTANMRYLNKGDNSINGASDLSNSYLIIVIELPSRNFHLDYVRIYYGDDHMGKINVDITKLKKLSSKSPLRTSYLYKFPE